MDTQESKIDVLVEIGGIYGSGMNVSSYPDITIAVLNYGTMDYQSRCKAEEQATEIRKGFKDASDLEIIRLAFPDIPAPIDWAKEIDHLLQVREKAIRVIKESFDFNEGHREVTIEGGQWCVEYISAIIQMFPTKNPRAVYTGLACPLETLLLLTKAIASK